MFLRRVLEREIPSNVKQILREFVDVLPSVLYDGLPQGRLK